jgi:hypothetical protein
MCKWSQNYESTRISNVPLLLMLHAIPHTKPSLFITTVLMLHTIPHTRPSLFITTVQYLEAKIQTLLQTLNCCYKLKKWNQCIKFEHGIL